METISYAVPSDNFTLQNFNLDDLVCDIACNEEAIQSEFNKEPANVFNHIEDAILTPLTPLNPAVQPKKSARKTRNANYNASTSSSSNNNTSGSSTAVIAPPVPVVTPTQPAQNYPLSFDNTAFLPSAIGGCEEIVTFLSNGPTNAGIPTPAKSSSDESNFSVKKPVRKEDNCKDKTLIEQLTNASNKHSTEVRNILLDMYFTPFTGETGLQGREVDKHMQTFRNKVHAVLLSLENYRGAIDELESAIFNCVLPLNSAMANFPDVHDISTISAIRRSNALKRAREDKLATEREQVLKQAVVDYLKPPKSYCLDQIFSKPNHKQHEVLFPCFMGYKLLVEDPDIKIHRLNIKDFNDFVNFLQDRLIKDKKYYKLFLQYLVVVGTKRWDMFKRYERKEIDELTYTEFCRKQSREKPPHVLLCK
ncbi:MAG: hypothetical protein V6Z82_04570 [Flavobacteriales bacterium]